MPDPASHTTQSARPPVTGSGSQVAGASTGPLFIVVNDPVTRNGSGLFDAGPWRNRPARSGWLTDARTLRAASSISPPYSGAASPTEENVFATAFASVASPFA